MTRNFMLEMHKFSTPKTRPECRHPNVPRSGFPQTPFLLILTDTMKLLAGSAGAAFRHPCRTASSAKKPPKNHPRGLKRPQRLPKVPPKTPHKPAQTPQKPAQSLPTEAKRPRKRHLAPRSVFQNRGTIHATESLALPCRLMAPASIALAA